MDTSERTTLSRFRGAILGAAVADALAFPYQHYSRSFLRSIVRPLTDEFAIHHNGFYPRGQYGDPTQVMLAVTASIVETREVSGPGIVERLIPLYRDNLLVHRERSTCEAVDRAMRGVSDWQECGHPAGWAEAAPAVRVVPISLWDHADLGRVVADVETSTRITHRDPRPAACSAAAAAAIAHVAGAEELILGRFLDAAASAAANFDAELAEAILDFPRILSINERRALRHFEALRPDDRYPPSDDGLGEYCVPSVCVALYYFLKSPYNWPRMVESCLRGGGQMDVPAFIAGALGGALNGETAIPSHLTESLLNVSEIANLAGQLFNAWEGTRGNSTGAAP